MMMAGQCTPHCLFETSKRKCAVHGGKEKMFRRVGPHAGGPPASGGGRLSIPRGRQGRKRAALGESFSPGESQIHSAPLSAAAGLSLRDKGRHMGRPLQNAGGFLFSCRGGPVCPPVGKPSRGRERQRGQKQGLFDFPPRISAAPNTRRRADTTELPGASRQKAGSLRRHRFWSPPSARRATAPEHDKTAFFSFGPSTACFLFGKTEKKMGGGMGKPLSRLDSSPNGVISNNFRTNSPI